jgi:hypothetical protein
MIELMTSVCLAAAVMVGQPAQDEATHIHVEFQLIEIDLGMIEPVKLSGEAGVRVMPSGTIEILGGVSASLREDSQAVISVRNGSSIQAGSWSYVIGGENDDLKDSPFRLVSSPKMLVLNDHQGGVSIGRPLEYLEPTEEVGVFRLVKDADRSEGVGFTIKPRLTASGGILFEPLGWELQEVVDREPVRGLDFPGVGRPVIGTNARELTVLIGEGETVILPITHRYSSERPLLLLVRPEARVMKPETLEEINRRINENAPDNADAPVQDPDPQD